MAVPGIKKGNLGFKKVSQEVCPRRPRERAELSPQVFFYKKDINFCALVFCPPPGGTHLLCDPSSPLPVETAPASQPIFAFEWEDPIGGNKQQLTWTHLPQGFENAPTIFGEALASDLEPFQPESYGCWLLQYVDDLLLATETWEECWEGTQALLQLLAEAGYRVLRKKAQICKEEVKLKLQTLPLGSITPERRRHTTLT
ncbi:uncharacterized protein ACBT57_014837 [Dama dama]